MATHKSDLIAAKDSLSVSDKGAFNANRTNATVRQATAVYTFNGSETTGDIIEIAELPVGAIVMPLQCYVADSKPTAFGNSGLHPRIQLGIGGDSRFGKVFDLGFGYTDHFGTETDAPDIVEPFPKATRVTAAFGYLAPVPAGGQIVFGISYAVNG